MRKGFLLFVFFVLSLSLFAQTISTQLKDNSWITITGKSNVIGFTFHQAGDKFIKEKMTLTARQEGDKVYLSENILSIKIKEFDSDNKMALKDFHKLIKADEYPYIKIKLDHFQIDKTKLDRQNITAEAHVNITIAGVENKYTIPVRGSEHNNYLTIKSAKKINIRDFKLVPPVKMLGLIKVDEWIEIEFNINIAIAIES